MPCQSMRLLQFEKFASVFLVSANFRLNKIVEERTENPVT